MTASAAPKKEPKILTESDFKKMKKPLLFGFYCYVRLDALPTVPTPQQHASIYKQFRNMRKKEIVAWLVRQKINV